MASHNMSTNLLVFFFIFFLFLSSPMEARKLLSGGGKVAIATLDAALFPSVLSKVRVPPSSPENRGHGMETAGEKLLASRSMGINKHRLGSVPSPGVGH